MPPLKILAFLQNMWVHDPEGVKAMLNRQRECGEFTQEQMREKVRHRLIHYALFAGCLTGRRLKKAFGEELCRQIVWEEGSREIEGKASTFVPPDLEHMLARCREEKPDLVLLFGKANAALCKDVLLAITPSQVICAPHPAARQATVPADLAKVGKFLRGDPYELPDLQLQRALLERSMGAR
jgi:hypothetical protein